MKKLYRKGTVHPSPPIISDHLAFLPAAILTLAAALSPEDREVLAYLISCSNTSAAAINNFSSSRRNNNNTAAAPSPAKKAAAAKGSVGDHPARFNCNCFRCYTSYWVRWDESPNRQLIHEIIDAFEDGLPAAESKAGHHSNSKFSNNSRKERRNNKRGININGSAELNRSELSLKKKEMVADHQVAGGGTNGGEESEKGSVRRFVSFVGERIWGVWSTKDEEKIN